MYDVAVLGLARNCAATLASTLDAVESWGVNARVVIGEDGSTDETRSVVLERADLVDTNPSTSHQARLSKMANAREKVKTFYERGERAELVIVMDMDGDFAAGIDDGWLKYAHLRLTKSREVFALSATSRPYYDLLAYESDETSFVNLDARIARAQKNPITYPWFKKRHIYEAQEALTRDTEISCISGFNGIAVYLDTVYARGSYLSNGPQAVCEHVIFHRNLAESGSRMIIDPSLAVAAPVEHVRRSPLELWAGGLRKMLAQNRTTKY